MAPSHDITINEPVELTYDTIEDERLTDEQKLIIALRGEISSLAGESTKLRSKIASAKTNVKRKFYLKKLGKNNNILADMIIRLDHLLKVKERTKNEASE